MPQGREPTIVGTSHESIRPLGDKSDTLRSASVVVEFRPSYLEDLEINFSKTNFPQKNSFLNEILETRGVFQVKILACVGLSVEIYKPKDFCHWRLRSLMCSLGGDFKT